MWKEYNPNPTGRRVEDCSVRAVAKALGISWEDAFALLSKNAYQMGDMAHSNSVIGSVLRMHGFYRKAIPNTCPDCYTAEDFLRDHPRGTFGDSALSKIIERKGISSCYPIIEETIECLSVVMPSLYNAMMRKLDGI